MKWKTCWLTIGDNDAISLNTTEQMWERACSRMQGVSRYMGN